MSKTYQIYCTMVVATILLFTASFQATMYLGDLLARIIY